MWSSSGERAQAGLREVELDSMSSVFSGVIFFFLQRRIKQTEVGRANRVKGRERAVMCEQKQQ